MLPKNKYPMSKKIEYNYNYNPKTSFIINYFTSLNTMLKTIDNVRCLTDEVEIIVINDNYGENTPEIMSHLQHRNDRMIVSRDLAERRGYHHGAQISNASDFIIFTQDDDLAPIDNKWYLDCINEFDKDPKLGIIGLLKGGLNYGQNNIKTLKDNYEKVYVSWLATGPLIIRKDLYFKVGAWSEEYSQIGEADGGADADITTKVLLNGYKSMLLRTPSIKKWYRRYNRDDGLTNENIKHSDKRKPTTERISLNNKIYYEKFKDQLISINKMVEKYNNDIGIRLN